MKRHSLVQFSMTRRLCRRSVCMLLMLMFGAAIAVVALLAGCSSGAADTSAEATATAGTDDESAGSIISSDIETMPVDGPGEQAALAALPTLLDDAKELLAASTADGQDMPEIDGVEPVFVGYLVSVTWDGQVTLCEVRADGVAHSLYAYNRAFDSGSLVWTPVDLAGVVTTEPQSKGENAAVAAVKDVMTDAFGSDVQMDVAICGYRFAYICADGRVLTLEVAPDSTLMSAVTS